eukprot:TRINITY_DN15588_c0_g1_i1.p1 TRINITY_DN15588_c0_g1~~TRINITY_DN15588_c0_g1_i1.p1  ORF type:complete len:176 (-),score=27.30 TRINITY_DN15588_c0_g1_i1:69-596(-)
MTAVLDISAIQQSIDSFNLAFQQKCDDCESGLKSRLDTHATNVTLVSSHRALKALENRCEYVSDELKQLKLDTGDLKSKHKYRLAELENAERFFQENFSLKFRRIEPSGLRLVFWNIDSRDPRREFSIDLEIDSQNQYKVRASSPVKNLENFVVLLNASNGFASFVRNVRKAFVY